MKLGNCHLGCDYELDCVRNCTLTFYENIEYCPCKVSFRAHGFAYLIWLYKLKPDRHRTKKTVLSLARVMTGFPSEGGHSHLVEVRV